MDSSSYTQFTTSRKLLYSYFHLKPSSGNESYILFLHGFPSSSYDWRHQVKYFSAKGYGIIVPDLLGYGGTAKPLDVQAYKGKNMARDVKEILEHEKIDKVIGVGHDWGSFLLSRLVNYYPSLFSKLAFVDIGYNAPGFGLTEQIVKHINSMVQGAMGYSVFGYFLFFAEPDAAQLLDAHSDSARSLFYSTDADLGKKYMGAEGGIRTWLEEGKLAESKPWFTSEDKEHYDQAFSSGYAAPINWYKAALTNINESDEKEIPQENIALKQPTLLISSTSFITVSGDFASQMKPNVPDLTVESLDCGHWIQLEKADEVNGILEKFFEG